MRAIFVIPSPKLNCFMSTVSKRIVSLVSIAGNSSNPTEKINPGDEVLRNTIYI
jgi:hypothetical protein